jgi:hypothetical protein
VDYGAEAFAFIRSDMTDKATGRLCHSWRDGQARNPATLEDYANMSRAALALYEATGDADYLAQAEAWVDILDRHYADPADGGYFMAADDTEGLLTRPKTAHDSAVPSGNGTLVGAFARLFYLTGKAEYRDKAERIVRTFSGELQRNFFPLASLLNGNEDLQRGLQVVIRGRRDEPGTEALLRAVNGVSLPTRIVTMVPPGAALPEGHPAVGKEAVDGRATAYVCEGPVCSLPFTDPEALAADLRAR